jgi:hypothetical protein
MDYVYILISDENSWEDMIIYLTEEKAIEASKTFPNWRVEVFIRRDNDYVPTYHYYKNGTLLY